MSEATAPVAPADRYAALQAAAAEHYHQVRIVVIPGGKIEAGDLFTVKPIEADPMSLDDALTWAEGYVAGDDAARRGDLYRKRDEARAESHDAMQEFSAKRRALRDAEAAIEADTNAALFPEDAETDQPTLTLPAGQLRKLLAEQGTPAAKQALAGIANLPDDAEVSLEPEE